MSASRRLWVAATLPAAAAAGQRELGNALVSFELDDAGLTSVQAAGGAALGLSNDGWSVVLGDIPKPSGKLCEMNATLQCSRNLGGFNTPTSDICAFRCMTADSCEGFTADCNPAKEPWAWPEGVPTKVPQCRCTLYPCSTPGNPGKGDRYKYQCAGPAPQLPDATEISSESGCGAPAVTSTANAVGYMYSCGAYRVNVTYELQDARHFVTKRLAVCSAKGGGCDTAGAFTVRRVQLWTGLRLDSSLQLGSVGINPFAKGGSWGGGTSGLTREVAHFWRRSAGGVFASLQNPFYSAAGGSFATFQWGPGRWAAVSGAAWVFGAAQTDHRRYLGGAPPSGSLQAVHSGDVGPGGATDAALLMSSVPARFPVTAAVSLLQGYNSNTPAPNPAKGGFSGVLLGAQHGATAGLSGVGVGVCMATDPKQQPVPLIRVVSFNGSGQPVVIAEANLTGAVTGAPIDLSVSVEKGGKLTASVGGAVAITADVSPPTGGVGLWIQGQDTSFERFTTSADDPPAEAVVDTGPPVVAAGYAPMLRHTAAQRGAWHDADAGVLGVTHLTGYEVPESGIDLGEWSAFVSCVDAFLLDKPMREKGAVRYQVAWDSNDYQLDMAKPADVAEYKRLIDRNAELGLTHQVYEPRNTLVSSRFNHTDAWWWEEVLWFQLGIDIRTGRWVPGRDKVPDSVAVMMDYFKQKGVAPAAYAYPARLCFHGEGDSEWLYDAKTVVGKAASLASPAYQDYLSDTMIAFLSATGGGGFAWDYGILGDPRVPNAYAEVRGWLHVLARLREAKPDIVMDHRQTAHVFGPWYSVAGSYSEPISGDENPESYGAELASLSTDHILADNLRLVNYRYRALQLLPNERVPGFMFHQTERHYDNGTGDDTGSPGDKRDKNGRPLWRANPEPDADGNYSGITYSPSVMTPWHRRDFDYLGYRYSVLSTIATAGRNLVAGNVPARDPEEFEKFPAADIAWIRKWFDFCDAHSAELRNTAPLVGHGYPVLGEVDGTAAVHNNSGYVFLFNPSPTAASASLTLDASLGLRPAQQGAAEAEWLVTEAYPAEDATAPLGVWGWGDRAAFSVPGGSARVLRLSPAPLSGPVVFNASYSTAAVGAGGVLTVSGARGLTGARDAVLARIPAGSPPVTQLVINGASVPASNVSCGSSPVGTGGACISAELHWDGKPVRTGMQAASPPPAHFSGGWYNATMSIPDAVFKQLSARQQKYDINWTAADLDASWLAPSRLLLYLYVSRPSPSLRRPRVSIDGEEVGVKLAFNSRGNHAVVPPGGGAASGNTARTFLGWYVDGTHLAPDTPHTLAVDMPEVGAGRFFGVFLHNVEDEHTSTLA